VFIPSAFSPDGAGPARNNKFFVVAQGYIGYNLKLYNRWGELLFESKDPEKEPWDGTYKGEPAQQDVYMYYAKVIAFDGKEYEYSGTVTLIR
jgi:gliding motility-associated-like protein